MNEPEFNVVGSKKPFVPYVKLFCKILDSSIWRQDMATRIVWITLLAMKDLNGYVMASPSAIADRARVSDEECEHALKVLSSPDPKSHTLAYEGRRIIPYEDGWYIVTHEKYKKMMCDERRKEYKKVWMAQKRAKAKIMKGPSNGFEKRLIDMEEPESEAQEEQA